MVGDAQLLAQLQSAQADVALEQLLQRHAPMVFRTARRLAADEQAADDICQAVFLLLMRKAGTISMKDNLASWLFRTTVLATRNWQREELRRKRRERAAADTLRSRQREAAPELPAGFDLALARLPEMYRQPIVLRYLENCSRDEAAAALRLSPNTLDVRLSRGLTKLRQSLAGAGLGVSSSALALALQAEGAQGAAAGLAASQLVTIKAVCLGHSAIPAAVASLTNSTANAMFCASTKIIAGMTAASLATASVVVAGVMVLGAPQALSVTLRLTSPQPNLLATGSLRLSVSIDEPSRVGTVEYLLNGQPITINGEALAPLPAPFSLDWPTVNARPGDGDLQAIARDLSGRLIGRSEHVPFQIGAERPLQLLSPQAGSRLSGTVAWSLSSSYALQEGENNVWSFIVDGVERETTYRPQKTFTHQLDTTQLEDGAHVLLCNHYIERAAGLDCIGSCAIRVTVHNPVPAQSLRTNFSHLHFTPGEKVIIQVWQQGSGSTRLPLKASFVSGNPSIATAAADGAIVAATPGHTTLTVTSGAQQARVVVSVHSARNFPHFSNDGRILTEYSAGESFFARTLRNLEPEDVVRHPELVPELKNAAVNTLHTGLYLNSADAGPDSDDAGWRRGMDDKLKKMFEVARRHDLRLFLFGDDLCRTRAELFDSVCNPRSIEKIQYVFKRLSDSRQVVAATLCEDVHGVWGDEPAPRSERWAQAQPAIPKNAFSTLMKTINAVPARIPLSWTISTSGTLAALRNWHGADFADFASISRSFDSHMHAYPAALSLTQLFRENPTEGWAHQAPQVWMISAEGPTYAKGGAGSGYQIGRDRQHRPGVQPHQITAQIVAALIDGAAALRVYAFENDSERQRRKSGPLPDFAGEWQTLCHPTEVGVQRWAAMAAAFRLVAELEPFILQAPAHAPDLGPKIRTAVRQGKAGYLLMALNLSELERQIEVDLSADADGPVMRQLLLGAIHSKQDLGKVRQDKVTLQPGEACFWVRPAE